MHNFRTSPREKEENMVGFGKSHIVLTKINLRILAK